MGAGSDIALDSADIVLIRNDLLDAVSALELGQVTMRKIRSNLGWAFVYNLIGIPLAMGLLLPWTGWLLPPAFAAAAMSLSSLSVVANSLLYDGGGRDFLLPEQTKSCRICLIGGFKSMIDRHQFARGSPSLVNGGGFRSHSLLVRRFESCPPHHALPSILRTESFSPYHALATC